ncbi:Beclin 1-associated autophagy-related key regulator [Trichinella papuae]|uniref:Beclin 1-associated autophagy-related key regulator n=1 Tax=Trichinella papuae TaxID=268474 RepID=A0A0V1M6W9_9BILA|nr:Beclin 1-associated autophagy-related key regulator [Trichinella papuae]
MAHGACGRRWTWMSADLQAFHYEVEVNSTAAKARPLLRCSTCMVTDGRLCCGRCTNDRLDLTRLKNRRRLVVSLQLLMNAIYEVRSVEIPSQAVYGELDRMELQLEELRQTVLLYARSISDKRRQLADLLFQNHCQRQVIDHLQSLCWRLERRIVDRNHALRQYGAQLAHCEGKLLRRRDRAAADVVRCVLPFEASNPEFFSRSPVSSPPTLALVKVTPVHYQRWLLAERLSATVFRFVDYCIAADYIVVNRLKRLLNVEPDSVEHRPERSTCAGLSFLAQLLDILARILDYRLPFQVSPVEFSYEHVGRARFQVSVLHLDANVLALRCSQRCSVDNGICYDMPFRNLFMFLSDDQLARLVRPNPLPEWIFTEYTRRLNALTSGARRQTNTVYSTWHLSSVSSSLFAPNPMVTSPRYSDNPSDNVESDSDQPTATLFKRTAAYLANFVHAMQK